MYLFLNIFKVLRYECFCLQCKSQVSALRKTEFYEYLRICQTGIFFLSERERFKLSVQEYVLEKLTSVLLVSVNVGKEFF